jgi:hypothetical protein
MQIAWRRGTPMTIARNSVGLSFPLIFSLLAVSACGGATAAAPAGESQGDGSVDDDASPDAGEIEAGPSVLAVAMSSCVPNVYTLPATIGGSEDFQLSLDTGSTTLGVASNKCTSCGGTNPVYTPGATAVDQHKTATSEYGSGSWTGEIYQDAVGIGASPTTKVEFAAIDTQSSFFEPLQCDSKLAGMQGIIGFGPAASAVAGTNGFFDDFVASQKVPNIFATELCDSGGTLWLGGFDPAFTTAAPQYTPLAGGIVSQYYYSVNLVSIGVNGTSVPIATTQFADSVVDTGTSVLLLGTTAFNALTAAIGADAQFQTLIGSDASWFSQQAPCAKLTQTKAEIDAALPPLTMNFGSNPAIAVQAVATESYLIQYGSGLWCSSLDSLDQGDEFPLASILGSPVLRSNVVIFDRAAKRIGFAPHTACK